MFHLFFQLQFICVELKNLILTCMLGAEFLAAKAEFSALALAPAILADMTWLALALRGSGEEGCFCTGSARSANVT